MEDTITLTPAMAIMVPILGFFLEALKRLPYIEKIKPFIPFISVGLGILLCYIWGTANPLIAGILVGIAASAGYDQTKGIVKLLKSQ